jgi:hypothetical protein
MNRTLLFFFLSFIAFTFKGGIPVNSTVLATFKDQNNITLDTNTRIAALDKAIEELKQSGVQYFFTYYVYSGGGTGKSIFVGPGPYPCESLVTKYLIWLEKGKTFIQAYDECKVYPKLEVEDPQLIAFYRKNLQQMSGESIKTFINRGFHMAEFQFVFYTPTGIVKKHFNEAYALAEPIYYRKDLTHPQQKSDQETRQANISTLLSRFLPIVDREKGLYNLTIDTSTTKTKILWKDTVMIKNIPVHSAVKPTLTDRTNFGSEYCRLLKLSNSKWLAVYTVSYNKGYLLEPNAGLQLEIAQSNDNGQHWKKISLISDPGRDLDNGELTLLKDGSLRLACRSVRWQQSYRLPVYKSTDRGKSWKRISVIDANEGKPGELGNPDQGVYEPHMLQMDNGDLAVMYASEKHILETGHLPQVVSQRISKDMGKSWGEEVPVVFSYPNNLSRPGMPVWTRMKNGKYILVYEICGTEKCNIFYKISDDGIKWESGFGNYVGGNGGPFIVSLDNGQLILTSNTGELLISDDYGKNWYYTISPWKYKVRYSVDWNQTVWSSIYQFGPNQIGAIASINREAGGHNIQMRYGEFKPVSKL